MGHHLQSVATLCNNWKSINPENVINSPDIDVLDDPRHRDHVAGTGGVAEVLGDLHLDRPRDLSRLVLRDLLDADALPVDRRRQRVVAQEGEAPRLAALSGEFDGVCHKDLSEKYSPFQIVCISYFICPFFLEIPLRCDL